MLEKRLQSYFEIANNHIIMIQKALKFIKPFYPFDSNFKEEINDDYLMFALDSLLFRFSKLQDHLGQKVFRAFLEYENYPTNNFFEILKALEKEEILNIDLWSVFREVRNELSHDYPEYEKISENINFIIEKLSELINISKKLESRFNEIRAKRN